MLKSKRIILPVAVMLASCAGSPDFKPAGVATPEAWGFFDRMDRPGALAAPSVAAQPAAQQAINHTWWQTFNDPVLTALITQALKHNLDLKQAEARVAEVRASRVGARARLFPQLQISAEANRGNNASAQQGGERVENSTQAQVEAAWELDLFGGTQKNLSAASALLQSEEARRHGVQVSLLAEVARNYFALRNLEAQRRITQANLDTQRQTLAIIQARYDQASASDFDLERAAAQVAITEAILPSLQDSYNATLNRLSVLLGDLPGNLEKAIPAGGTYASLSPQILVAAPATVLANRPDVLAAERQFASAVASAQAATRDWLPKINLLGFFGVRDTESFATTPWNVAAQLVQPVLNFGRISSQIDAANARQQQAFFAYQQSVLRAVEDMENALSAYMLVGQRLESLRQAFQRSARAAELARLQFKAGDIDLLEVLLAEREQMQVESEFANAEALQRQNLANLFAATGGGWQLPGAKE